MNLAVLRSFIPEIARALLLATLTAIVTLVLIIVVSLAVGGENRAQAERQRCYAALSNAMLHDLLDDAGIANDYPRVDASGLDCSFIADPVPN